MSGKYASPFDAKARVIGLVSTLCVHAGIFCGMTAEITPAPPPEEDMEILIDFSEEISPMPEPEPIEVKSGREPRARNVSEEINLVQKAEAPEKGLRENRGEESTMGDEGDVEKPEPPRKEIDRRALFASAKNRQADTSQAQVAENPRSDRLKEGHASGNTLRGRTDGTPTARLEGRTVVGALPEPEYASKDETGQVVVSITVDAYGNVIDATPGAAGTTVQSANLWAASKKAALKAKFSNGTSAVQKGTITYVFKLK